jgi:hypothetical protein
MVEDTGWSCPPWPERMCHGELRKAMVSSGKSSMGDGGRLFKETTTMGVWPMLTQTNYTEWALLMQVNLEATEVWESIDPGTSPHKNDWMLLGCSSMECHRRCGRSWPRRRLSRRHGRR